jgi:outer membrane protein assembly factor BamB
MGLKRLQAQYFICWKILLFLPDLKFLTKKQTVMRIKNLSIFLIILSLVTITIIHSCKSGSDKKAVDKSIVSWGNDNNLRWTFNIDGKGWSSPVIFGNKVFFTTAVNETNPSVADEQEEDDDDAPPPPADSTKPRPQAPPRPQGPPPAQKEDTTYKTEVYRWELNCLDLKTGELLWNKVALKGSPKTGSHKGNGYASETPVTNGRYIYAYFGMIGIFCYDMEGNLVWKKDMGAYKTLNNWGTGSSPALYEDMIFLQIDNEVSSFIVALDANTGDEKWRVTRDEKTTYSTPVLWNTRTRSELVAGGKKTRSYDPATGKMLWELNMGWGMSIPTAVPERENLYIGNAGGPDSTGNLFNVKAGAKGDISLEKGKLTNESVQWFLPAAGTGNPSPVLFNGLIYLLASDGKNLGCFDASTGNTVYSQKLVKVSGCWATPWIYKGNLYITDERGVTTIVKTGPVFEVLGQNRLSDKFWASPSITNKEFVFKGAKKIYCINL